jgi:hypothetical protein
VSACNRPGATTRTSDPCNTCEPEYVLRGFWGQGEG